MQEDQLFFKRLLIERVNNVVTFLKLTYLSSA